ncbi:cellulose synthase operon protein c [Anaeramoeba flamelloides]|uniref:Cellulose synthase operon protein c n=1 Tax=Anaeramoeba flamelloides TaxID=1746091 RepID=A0AAV7YCF4_9EUKA|nr:cellulose synthase operon protein c [Anaeramoeba flamelloides]
MGNKSVSQFYEKANSLVDEKEYKKAEKMYRKAINKRPTDFRGYKGMGAVSYEQGDSKAAASYLRKALMYESRSQELNYQLAQILYQMKEYEESQEHFEKAILLNEEDPKSHSGLGNIFIKAGNLESAIKQFSIALKLDPKDATVHYEYGCALYNMQKYEECLKSFKHSVVLNPGNSFAWYYLGKGNERLNRIDEAIKNLKQASELNSNFGIAFRDLGILQYKSQHLTEALSSLQRATELLDGDCLTFLTLGFVHCEKENPNEASVCFKKTHDLYLKNNKKEQEEEKEKETETETETELGNRKKDHDQDKEKDQDQKNVKLKTLIPKKKDNKIVYYESIYGQGMSLFLLRQFDKSRTHFLKIMEINLSSIEKLQKLKEDSSLFLKKIKLREKFQKELLIAQNNGPELKKIDWGGLDIQLNQSDCLKICKLIKENRYLRTLKLYGDHGIKSESLCKIIASINDSSTIEKIKISGLTPEESRIIGALINNPNRNHQIQSMRLSFTEIGSKRIEYICDALHSNNYITKLQLQLFHCGVGSAKIMGEMLKKNKSITELKLSSCKINCKVVKSLIEAFSLNTSIRILDLSNNLIQANGCKGIAKVLAKNQTIISIDLSNNPITGKGFENICKAIKKNHSLESLVLNGQTFGKLQAKMMSSVLERNLYLIQVHFQVNKETQTHPAMKKIEEKLERNRQLILPIKRDFINLLNKGHLADDKIHGIPLHKSMLRIRIPGNMDLDNILTIMNRYSKAEVADFLFWVYGDFMKTSNNVPQIAEKLGIHNLKDFSLISSLKNLYNDQDSKDFQIFCGNKIIKAHKMILVARSGFFRKLILDSNNQLSSFTDHSGKSPQALYTLIQYMYTDEINPETNEIMLLELENAVEEYQLNRRSSLKELFNFDD